MAELIAAGTTLVNSSDFTVAAGGSATLYLKGAAGTTSAPYDCIFVLQHKTPAGDYMDVQKITATNITQVGNIVGAGTFRVQRLPCTYSIGMDIQQ